MKLFKRGAKRRVLIVDDDQDIRETLSEALEHEGFQVLTARDGGEALIHLNAPGPLPDVILLDLMMPRMNGFELREVLRHHPVFAGIPVVAITASSDGGRFDAPAVMRKPIPLENLLDAIDRVDAARLSTATG